MLYLLIIIINICSAIDNSSSTGFCTRNPSFSDCENIKNNHIDWIRIGTLWSQIEKEKGVYNWVRLDSVINNAQENNLNILLLISYGNRIYLNDSLKTDNFVSDSKLFTNDLFIPYEKFLKRLITRYKNKIYHFEIWNEPDLENHWRGLQSDYFKLLKLSYNVIKDIHPNSFVLNGGISGKNIDSWFNLLSNQYSDFFDIFNFHLYKHCNKKVGLYNNYLKEVIKITNKMKKPIWITETGLAKKNDISTYCGGYSQKTQISETIRRLLINKNYGIEKTFIFSYRNRCKDKMKMSCNYGYIENPYFGTDFLKNILKDIQTNSVNLLDINTYKLSNGKTIEIINNEIIYN